MQAIKQLETKLLPQTCTIFYKAGEPNWEAQPKERKNRSPFDSAFHLLEATFTAWDRTETSFSMKLSLFKCWTPANVVSRWCSRNCERSVPFGWSSQNRGSPIFMLWRKWRRRRSSSAFVIQVDNWSHPATSRQFGSAESGHRLGTRADTIMTDMAKSRSAIRNLSLTMMIVIR